MAVILNTLINECIALILYINKYSTSIYKWNAMEIETKYNLNRQKAF